MKSWQRGLLDLVAPTAGYLAVLADCPGREDVDDRKSETEGGHLVCTESLYKHFGDLLESSRNHMLEK
jgi:hypothetical protein